MQGTSTRPGATGLVVTVQVVNHFASALVVGFWIDKTYNFRVRPWEEVLECVPLEWRDPRACVCVSHAA